MQNKEQLAPTKMRNQRPPNAEGPPDSPTSHDMAFKLNKIALIVFILTVAASSGILILDVIAVYDWQDEIVQTCFAVLLACALIVLCTPALVKEKITPTAHIGMACTMIFLALAISAIWTGNTNVSDQLAKMTLVFGFVSVGLAYICIVHLFSKAPLFLVVTAEVLMVASLSVIFKWIVSEAYGTAEVKVFFSIGITVAALTIIIVMLHAVSNDGVEAAPQEDPTEADNDIEAASVSSSISFVSIEKDLPPPPPPTSPDARDLPTAIPVPVSAVDFTQFVIEDRKKW